MERAGFAVASFLLILALSSAARESRADGPPGASLPSPSTGQESADPVPARIEFPFAPEGSEAADYPIEDRADWSKLVLLGRLPSDATVPVVIALHGQPAKGKLPRDYAFGPTVTELAARAVDGGRVRPFALVLPTFRYRGRNWPDFDLRALRLYVERLLSSRHLTAGEFYVVGHSAAAGCGGEGMNLAHRMRPAAVGFFDTCLGSAFGDEVLALQRAHIPTLIVHSVETAGYLPRQYPEYQDTFDFGKVYGRLGLVPVVCPADVPGALRPQAFRCASKAGTRAFVVDTGRGEAAHNAALPVGLTYFLRQFLATGP